MDGRYVAALETRLGWLRWCDTSEAHRLFGKLEPVTHVDSGEVPYVVSPLQMARWVLETGPTFYMAPQFCSLVDVARQDVPSDLEYDPEWLLAPDGWLWMDTPVQVPDLMAYDKELTPEFTAVRAVGWRHIKPGLKVVRPDHIHVAGEGTTHFLFFVAFSDYRVALRHEPLPIAGTVTAEGGFGVWSYFTLAPGDRLDDRVARFENGMRERDPLGQYVDREGRKINVLHEIRWLFCSLKLMAQRLATRIRVPTARHVRRRAERGGQVAPPYLEVVTLRRLRHYAVRSGQEGQREVVDWQWQWVVNGHWRNQWYPAEGIHKPKFIESYLKGPEDRPLKPAALKLFVVRR